MKRPWTLSTFCLPCRRTTRLSGLVAIIVRYAILHVSVYLLTIHSYSLLTSLVRVASSGTISVTGSFPRKQKHNFEMNFFWNQPQKWRILWAVKLSHGRDWSDPNVQDEFSRIDFRSFVLVLKYCVSDFSCQTFEVRVWGQIFEVS